MGGVVKKVKKVFKRIAPILAIATAGFLLAPAFAGTAAAAGAAGTGVSGSLLTGAAGFGGAIGGTTASAATIGSLAAAGGGIAAGATGVALGTAATAVAAPSIFAKILPSILKAGATSLISGTAAAPKLPAIPKIEQPAPPAPVRSFDTGAAVLLGTSSLRDRRVSGGGVSGRSRGVVDILGGLGRGGGI